MKVTFVDEEYWEETICCPFHRERTPSCVIKNGRFHCHGCLREGTVKQLERRLKRNAGKLRR